MKILSKKSIAANSNENVVMASQKVVGDEFVQTDISEINIDRIDNSRLEKVLKGAQNFQKEKLSAQNDNNQDNGGDDTPPPADAIALPVPDVSNGKQTKAVAVINKKLNNLVIPTNPADWHDFITVGKKAVEAAQSVMKHSKGDKYGYNTLHNNTKIMAETLLDIALQLAAEVRAIEGKQGHHDLSGVGTSRSKEQILEQDFNMTAKQGWRIAKLTDDTVRKEKNYANDNEVFPTIAHAIKYVEAKERQLKMAEKKKEAFEATLRSEKKVLSGGKYDVILGDSNSLSTSLDVSEASPTDAIMFIICDKAGLASSIELMQKNGFIYADCAVIIKSKMLAGSSKCFQNYHKMLLVGIKGNYASPFVYKGRSVIYETDMAEVNEISYIQNIIEHMYPDGAYLDLISDVADNPKWDNSIGETEVKNA